METRTAEEILDWHLHQAGKHTIGLHESDLYKCALKAINEARQSRKDLVEKAFRWEFFPDLSEKDIKEKARRFFIDNPLNTKEDGKNR